MQNCRKSIYDYKLCLTLILTCQINSFTANRLYIGEVERSCFTDRHFIGEVSKARLKPLCIVIINKNPSKRVSLCSPNYNLLFGIQILVFISLSFVFLHTRIRELNPFLPSQASKPTRCLLIIIHNCLL